MDSEKGLGYKLFNERMEVGNIVGSGLADMVLEMVGGSRYPIAK